MRSRLLPGLLIGLGLLGSAGPAMAGDTAAQASEARAAIQRFSAILGAALKSAMENAGPVATIEVCNLKAAELAKEASEATGWQVGRTALKLRNPRNAPDAWEKGVLAAFATRAAAGEELAKLDETAVIVRDGHPVIRYMKAIPTAALCLTCHGGSLKPEVQTRLLELYPADQATGFALGDLRGAFTLTRRLD
ncbi:MAG: DUF3365 domain-containing protein [Rhodospirillaceae bacterium]